MHPIIVFESSTFRSQLPIATMPKVPVSFLQHITPRRKPLSQKELLSLYRNILKKMKFFPSINRDGMTQAIKDGEQST
jgi:hypothetical protein